MSDSREECAENTYKLSEYTTTYRYHIKEAMFPEGEQAHTQAGLFYGVLQLQTVGSAPALSERTPEGSSELSTAAHFHERERV